MGLLWLLVGGGLGEHVVAVRMLLVVGLGWQLEWVSCGSSGGGFGGYVVVRMLWVVEENRGTLIWLRGCP